MLPGVGSLAAAGVGTLSSKDLTTEIATELSAAVGEIAAKTELPRRAFLRRRRARSERKKVERLLVDRAGSRTLIGLPRPAEDSRSEELGRAQGQDDQDSEEEEMMGLARAQFALAGSPGRVPGAWQDEFAALLQASATDGLREVDPKTWRTVIPGDSRERPSGDELAEWTKLVTRVFAARLSANPRLVPFVNELKAQDRLAMDHAVLLRLDQQRRALELIAGVLLAAAGIAAALLGLDITGLDLGI